MHRSQIVVVLSLLAFSLPACFDGSAEREAYAANGPMLQVLGTLQDGGAPHIGCNRPCCRNLFLRPATDRKVVCLGVTDTNADGEPVGAMFEATPDFPSQLQAFQSAQDIPLDRLSVFLTHAHIGHYSGLMFLGREALGANNVDVWTMPRFREFLTTNGPWSQLVELGNIRLNSLTELQPVSIGESVRVVPLRVPHRDEYSETVGYRIEGPRKAALFIPDINKWELWERALEEELAKVDYAFLDATFYDAEEVGYRDMAEIPHPFMVETMQRLAGLPSSEKSKVHFIHLNHTNPCLDTTSQAYRTVIGSGFNAARFGQTLPL
ncbi:MAG: MBL fold metallo-hydrolase [Bacteroidota bacterium]|nr:MBL fold metallo-hydrolase [Bacteroidota bacterium]